MVLQIRSVFFFQTFKDGIRQFLRGNFCPDVFRVLLRIVVTPVAIFVLRDLTTPETAGLLSAVSAEESLPPEAAAAFFEPLAALVHGYASLIANNGMHYDEDAIRNTLITIAEGLERKEA